MLKYVPSNCVRSTSLRDWGSDGAGCVEGGLGACAAAAESGRGAREPEVVFDDAICDDLACK